MNILGGDSDSDVELSINKDYAKDYNRWRKGEELQKLKDKYGEEQDSRSETSSSEDDDGEELTEEVEKQFFKTLSCLKKKDSKIYDETVSFFPSKNATLTKKKKKNDEPLTVAKYQRNLILEKNGKLSEDEDNIDKPYVQKEKDLKNSFKNVMESEDSGDDEWGKMFKKKIKSKEDEETEENEYRKWLAGQTKNLYNKDDENELKYLHDYWNNPDLDEGEKFLRDYILNKRFLEKDKGENGEHLHDSETDLSADEETLTHQEDFERKFNFRFEEPDQEFIKRYPRTMDNTMRKKDDKRKRHREEVKARKAAERAKKDEELKRLKALKRSEIMDKLKKLQEITGNNEMDFNDNDIEGDFDPDLHDRRMSQLFDDNYYNTHNEEEKKPEFPELDEELEIENWNEWSKEENSEALHCEDPDFNMDCDFDPTNKKSLEVELTESTKSRRKKRRQSKFAAALAKKKPLFDPKDKSFEKYVDEYYSLDYEDLIGDIPCRFKYRKVVPNDFGLSIDEILSAPDKELNKWASLKKITQRRPEHIERYDVTAYRKKAADIEKKKKILPSVFSDSAQSEETNKETIKRKKNSESDGIRSATETLDSDDSPLKKTKTRKLRNHSSSVVGKKHDSSGQMNEEKTKKKEKRKKNNLLTKNLKGNKNKKLTEVKNISENETEVGLTDARLKAYGLNPKKFKNKVKYSRIDNF